MSQYLSEAFKRLDALNEETFSITDNGLEDYVEFQDNDELDTTIDVIDMEAETEEDLEDSYVGKVILDCCVCHSKLYKDVEDVVIDGDLANTNEECPFCYTTDGFKVIGQVATFGEEPEVETDGETEEAETDDKVEESLKESKEQKVVRRNPNRRRGSEKLGEFLPGAPKLPGITLNASLDKGEEDLEEFLDANVTLDARGFGGKDNNVSVLGGKLPSNESKSDKNEKISRRNPNKVTNEGIFDKFKKKDSKSSDTEDSDNTDKYPNNYWVPITFHEKSNSWVYVQGTPPTPDKASAEKVSKEQAKHNPRADRQVITYGKAKALVGRPFKESLEESVNNVNVETDDGIVNVSSDENGRVTVTTEPNTSGVSDADVIAPLEPEVQSEISDNVGDGEEIEIDMDEFDEESFDELGEGYLKRVYENVNSFKTSNVSFIKDKLILEGVIKFNSGKAKKTNFIFGIREATKSGKVRFIGENKEIARGRKSFTVTGRVENKKFLSESLNYNYGVRTANGKAQRLYGTVKNKRGK